jgi:hypothetical protein
MRLLAVLLASALALLPDSLSCVLCHRQGGACAAGSDACCTGETTKDACCGGHRGAKEEVRAVTTPDPAPPCSCPVGCSARTGAAPKAHDAGPVPTTPDAAAAALPASVLPLAALCARPATPDDARADPPPLLARLPLRI